MRLGGRQSVDFDFFTNQLISADVLTRPMTFLRGAELIQAEPNTCTFTVEREGGVNVSFFGGLTIGRVGKPDRCEDNRLQVASLLDLAAQKMKIILVRAEAKDYLDIDTLLHAGISLPEALGATKALYAEFNLVLSLKALAYYGESTLATVPIGVRKFLTAESARVESIKTVQTMASRINLRESLCQSHGQNRGKGIGI